MKSNLSWQDALSSLRSEMDDSVDEQVVETQEEKEIPSSDNLAIFYERKGRGGKEATIITGFT
ncbi:MAG: translation initiation factor, partial [Paramuribaculum sp.]|nr:translation initiation factor [Paramuribaculum sp.]